MILTSTHNMAYNDVDIIISHVFYEEQKKITTELKLRPKKKKKKSNVRLGQAYRS